MYYKYSTNTYFEISLSFDREKASEHYYCAQLGFEPSAAGLIHRTLAAPNLIVIE